ncbi:MAG: TRAP transporter large permease [Bosea sp. (in: a-proteobacteria)]|uniref:TRAP transporter large permease n=1 Tax=Bosea sp. (in: a-proteobacteria) TaxID=1871050 RepID=UPI001ACBB2DB|nr:TRAP transporter large permease [Bosea sp. (in: a-proteobacteria)]MBN9444678.1 TRAP transporter large permease [Bosea sp. (in: a-proteobacteria)]
MSPAALLGVFLSLTVIGLPIAFVLLGTGIAVTLSDPDILDVAYIQNIIVGTQSFPLIAIPLFILAGELMNISGITRRLMDFASALTAHMIGGLAQVNIVLSMLQAGMTGSANAEAAMHAKTLNPEMVRRGYSPAYAAIITSASALIAPMIPPGIGLILYGFVTDLSIGKLFMAGIVPGLIMTAGMMIMSHWVAKRRKYEHSTERASPARLLQTFWGAVPAMLMPAIIVIGIRIGIFTASEAGAMAVLYALLFCAIYRECSWRDIADSLASTATTTSVIMIILAASTALSWALSFEQLPQKVAEMLVVTAANKFMLFLIVAVLLLIAGMFVEGTALILILAPMFAPAAVKLGVDPIHFGIFFVYMIHLGGITPPVGTVMFTTCTIARVPLQDFIRESLPWLAMLLGIAALIAAVPGTATWLGYL